MKSLKQTAVFLIILSGTAFFVSGQTLKERIDQAKVVKVYFKNADIVSRAKTDTQNTNSISGSGCENFKETTPLPAEYTEVVKLIIDLLNKGFNTTAFVAGDFSVINDLPLASTGELNWLKLGEPLAFYVSTSGAYYVRRPSGTIVRNNTLEVQSYLYAFAVTEGKLKNLVSKMLVSEKSPIITSEKCEDYAWFVRSFPASSLSEPFKIDMIESITDFTRKEMSKYDKTMMKKK
jgi:hypothetical protein